MDIKEFIEEAHKLLNDQEIPWHLKTLCEHIEIVKNGRKIIINPIRQVTFNEMANRLRCYKG